MEEIVDKAAGKIVFKKRRSENRRKIFLAYLVNVFIILTNLKSENL